MNKYKVMFFVFSFLLFAPIATSQEYIPAQIAINFSPNNGVAKQICEIITSENDEVLLMGSKLTSKTIENCLINIKKNGRRVFVILDSKFIKKNYDDVKSLLRHGVCIYSDSIHKTAHNKVVVSGDDFVFSGSYNFTDQSEYLNSENGIFIRSNEVRKVYTAEFLNHLKHSHLIKSKFTDIDQCQR